MRPALSPYTSPPASARVSFFSGALRIKRQPGETETVLPETPITASGA
jgi:hypothetical protein